MDRGRGVAWLLVGWWLASIKVVELVTRAGFPRLASAFGWLTGYRVAWGLARAFGWHPFGA